MNEEIKKKIKDILNKKKKEDEKKMEIAKSLFGEMFEGVLKKEEVFDILKKEVKEQKEILSQIKGGVDGISERFKNFKIDIPPYPEIPKFPDKIKIEKPEWYKEPEKVKIPESFEVKGFSGFVRKINGLVEEGISLIVKAIKSVLEVKSEYHKNPDNALAVKVVDRRGRYVDFEKMGGGGAVPPPAGTSPSILDLEANFKEIDVSSAGDNVIVSGVSGKKIRVLQYTLICGGSNNLRWYSGSSSGKKLSGLMQFLSNGGVANAFSPIGLFETNEGEDLVLNLSSGSNVGGHLVYVLI